MTYETKCATCGEPVVEGDPVLAFGTLGHERIELDGAVACLRGNCGGPLELEG